MVVRIRSITAGYSKKLITPNIGKELSILFDTAEEQCKAAGFSLQTKRLVLDPLHPCDKISRPRLFSILDSLFRNIDQANVRWVCLPVSMDDFWETEDLLGIAPELIKRFPFLFLHFMAAEKGNIYTHRLPCLAQNILDISRLSGNGFDNFRVGVGCNIRQNTPFFPFSWHDGDAAFSIAVETIDTLLDIADNTPEGTPLSVILSKMEKTLSAVCLAIDTLGYAIEKIIDGRFAYRGMDISLAPFPDGRRSVARLMELFAPTIFGVSGSLTTTALFSRLIKKVLRETGVKQIGFNGVMYSPLEDDGLAAAMKYSHSITIEKLCLYSTVCGCGVDMVPIAGDTRPEDLASLIQDIAVLSCALQKPLGIRVLPIPMRGCNELTKFNHDFLVNTRILSLTGQGLLERFPIKELLLP